MNMEWRIYLGMQRQWGMQEEAANGLGKEMKAIFKSFLLSRSSLCNVQASAHNLKPRLICHWKLFKRGSEIAVPAHDGGDEHCI